MNYREHLFCTVVDYVGGFADLTGDFNARDNIAPIIKKKLVLMSDKEIHNMLVESSKSHFFAMEVLEEMGLII